jgi:hypothetical protein
VTYQGKVENGAIILDPGVELPEGAQVRIELIESSRHNSGSDPLFRMTDLAVDTGIPDLATNIDHYLYGHPKQSDAG